MKNVTNDFELNFEPFLGIVAYKAVGENDKFYLEGHVIKNGAFLEGKPLKQSTLLGIASTIYDENQGKIKFGGLIPANLICSETYAGGDYKLVWHRPEEERTLFFAAGLEIASGKAWVPAMIYVATKKTLSVYAVKTNKRPNEKTKIYKAPFHNVYATGNVCLGSAKVKQPELYTFDNVKQYWEDMFWKSEFTHMNGGNFCKTNGNVVWKDMLSNPGKKWSATDELVPNATIKTLKQLI